MLFSVTFFVPSDFRYPEVAVCFGYLAALRAFEKKRIRIMTMPEAPIHKDACAVFP